MASNLFLDAKELMLQNDGLNYINYETLSENNKEFLRSDVWDFFWSQPAAAVYFPGNAMLRARTQAVNPQFPVQLGQMTAIIRQFQIQQSTISGTTAGSISIDYNDREDQAIFAWLDDWRDKCGDREHRYAFRKEDVVAQGRLTIYNSSRKPIRIYDCLTMQITDPGNGLNPSLNSDDPQNVGQVSATFSFEHFKLAWKNI
jgi:hypothetical protein